MSKTKELPGMYVADDWRRHLAETFNLLGVKPIIPIDGPIVRMFRMLDGKMAELTKFELECLGFRSHRRPNMPDGEKLGSFILGGEYEDMIYLHIGCGANGTGIYWSPQGSKWMAALPKPT